AVTHFDQFHMRIKLLPLTGPVGTNLFFPNHTTTLRCLGPADVLTHERQGAVSVSLVKSRVGPSYQCLCVCHESSSVPRCTLQKRRESPRRLAPLAFSKHKTTYRY